ncbi:MAG TPA: DUF763 domain-containing protein [Methanothrix sp.]|nr:DUF763 domain-containing protein [Methanothrix sp.]
MRTGVANLPLHGGKAPPWLFKRMVGLAGAVVEAVIYEHGSEELLRRVSDPCWFQALSCVLGFDWHSSGTTTTTTGALKLAINPEVHGLAVAGGKGKTGRKAPLDIQTAGDLFAMSPEKIEELKLASKMAAKVDNALVQDGYRLYHHVLIFSDTGSWAVVQQGMSETETYARRYHWLSERVASFVEEPHSAICAQDRLNSVLDLTSMESRENRDVTLDLVKDGPAHFLRYTSQRTLSDFSSPPGPAGFVSSQHLDLTLPRRHEILPKDLGKDGIKALEMAYEIQPERYEDLIALKGMGPKRIRALALISELIYGAETSWKDPAKFSFAHGGKDGYPYPVDRETFDHSITTLKEAVENAKLDKREKYDAIKRLKRYTGADTGADTGANSGVGGQF